MKQKSLPFWSLLVIISITLSAITVTAFCGNAYTTGNWVVSSSINCSNELISLNGTLAVQDISETVVTNFNTAINSAQNLKQNSNRGIIPAIPDLDSATPGGYSPDWDTDTNVLFKIVMNQSNHLIQIYMDQPGPPPLPSVTTYFIDTDINALTGCMNPPSPACPAGTSTGPELKLEWSDPDGPGPGVFAPSISCWNTSINNFQILSPTPTGNFSCNATGATQNFTIFWNISGLALEAVIDVNGPWVDKPIVKLFSADPPQVSYTKFKNTAVIIGAGNLTMDNITLQITGNLGVTGGLFTVRNSSITFGLTNNGSANMTGSGVSTIFIDKSILTANSTLNFLNNWGYTFGVSSFTLTNSNISYMGIGAATDGFTKAGLIQGNRFSNCWSQQGWCLNIIGPSVEGLVISNNTFLGAPNADALRITNGVNMQVNSNQFNSRLWIGGQSTNNVTISGNTFTQLDSVTAIDIDNVGAPNPPSNITFTNNNFSTNPGTGISDNVLAGTNTLVYNNAFGEIAWLNKNNLTFTGTLNIGDKVNIGSNLLGLAYNPGLLNLNASARLTFVGLNYTTQPKILRNGIECSNNPTICNITLWSSGTLVATVSGFGVGNYTTNTSVYGGGTSDCFSYRYNQNGCLNAGCTYDSFTQDCRLNFESLTCNDFCGKCSSSSTCNSSTKACVWKSQSFCMENFGNFTYGSGGNLSGNMWTNVSPPNCANNPTQCDSMFDSTYNYVRFEGSCFDSTDNDVDGTTDCNDSDCYNAPECSGSYNASADTTPPQVKNTMVISNNDSALISLVTSEPTSVKILFYNTSATCAILNKTLSESNDPSTTLDDYMVNHFFPIDNRSLGWSLTPSLNYYYKINATDKAGNGYLSSCTNITTRAVAATFVLNFSGSGTSGMQFDLGAGFVNYSVSTGLSVNRTEDAVMRFTNQPFQFRGIDLSQSSNFEFGNAFYSGSAFAFRGKAYVGFNSTLWQQMVQQLGVKNVTMQLTATDCNRISRCNDDSSVCTDVTAQVNCVRDNSTSVNVTIHASLGFSTYVAGTNAQLNITDDTDSTTKEVGNSINFYANYTNTSNITLTPTGSNASCNITIANISVTNVGMTFNVSGDGRWNYTTSAFTATGTFNWSVNCSATGYDTLNATDNVTISDITAPIITVISPLATTTNTTPDINVSTNEAATCQYKSNSTNYTNMATTGGTSHAQNLSAALSAGDYTYFVRCNDSIGNLRNTSVPFVVTTAASNAVNISNFTLAANQSVNLATLSNVNITLNLSRAINSTISVAEYNSTPTASFSLTGYTVSSFRFYALNAEDLIKNNINKITLAINYNQTVLTAAGISEADLVMYYYNLTSSAWQQENNYAINTVSDLFTANLTHLSNFVLGTVTVTPSSSSSSSSSSGGGSGGASGSGWGYCGDTVCNDGEKCAPSKNVNEHKSTCYKDCGLCKVTTTVKKSVIANKTVQEAPAAETLAEPTAPEVAPESLSEQLKQSISTEKLDIHFWLSFVVAFIVIVIVFYLLEQKHKRARPDEPDVEDKKKSPKSRK